MSLIGVTLCCCLTKAILLPREINLHDMNSVENNRLDSNRVRYPNFIKVHSKLGAGCINIPLTISQTAFDTAM